jgi:hypothetical protein
MSVPWVKSKTVVSDDLTRRVHEALKHAKVGELTVLPDGLAKEIDNAISAVSAPAILAERRRQARLINEILKMPVCSRTAHAVAS